jgi:hypothetical protein
MDPPVFSGRVWMLSLLRWLPNDVLQRLLTHSPRRFYAVYGWRHPWTNIPGRRNDGPKGSGMSNATGIAQIRQKRGISGVRVVG